MGFVKNSGIVATSPITHAMRPSLGLCEGHLSEMRVRANAPQPYRFNMLKNNLTDLPTSPRALPSRVGVLLSLEKAKDICQKYEFELTPPNLTDSICWKIT